MSAESHGGLLQTRAGLTLLSCPSQTETEQQQQISKKTTQQGGEREKKKSIQTGSGSPPCPHTAAKPYLCVTFTDRALSDGAFRLTGLKKKKAHMLQHQKTAHLYNVDNISHGLPTTIKIIHL